MRKKRFAILRGKVSEVYLNGLLQREGIKEDYIVDKKGIKFVHSIGGHKYSSDIVTIKTRTDITVK